MEFHSFNASRIVELACRRIRTLGSTVEFSHAIVAAGNVDYAKSLIDDALEVVAAENLDEHCRDAAAHILGGSVAYRDPLEDSRAMPIAEDYAALITDHQAGENYYVSRACPSDAQSNCADSSQRAGLVLLLGTTPIHRRSAAMEFCAALSCGAANLPSDSFSDFFEALSQSGNWRIRASVATLLSAALHDPAVSDELRQKVRDELLLTIVADGHHLVRESAEKALNGFDDLGNAVLETANLEVELLPSLA